MNELSKNVEVVGQVDEQHRLVATVPPDVPPGPIKILLQLEADQDEEHSPDWSKAIARAWANDWSDPREDIYTLEDGEPSR